MAGIKIDFDKAKELDELAKQDEITELTRQQQVERGELIQKVQVRRDGVVTGLVQRPRTLYRFLLENNYTKAQWAEMRIDPKTAEYCERIELELQDDMVCNALIGNYDPSLVSKILGLGQEETVVTPAINVNLTVNGKEVPNRIEIGKRKK